MHNKKAYVSQVDFSLKSENNSVGEDRIILGSCMQSSKRVFSEAPCSCKGLYYIYLVWAYRKHQELSAPGS